MSSVSIYTNNLAIGYRRGTDVRMVQRDLSFSLLKGEMVCMLGRNGVGKSTLLRTLAGLQHPLSGECNIFSFSPNERARYLSLVLTERVGVENTTVRDVVAMGRYPYLSLTGALRDADRVAIDEALRCVGIEDMSDAYFNTLSDGERQRVLIAKAVAQHTSVILLDEPTAHLDLPNRITVLQLLRRLAHDQDKTILISTHELELALALSDRILLLYQDGFLLDTPASLTSSKPLNSSLATQDPFTHAFGMDIFHPLG